MAAFFRNNSRRDFLSAIALIAMLGFLSACTQPFTAPRNTIGFSAGMIASQLGSRSLASFESIRVQVSDSSGTEVLNQLVTGAPADNQVVVELERGKSYVLTLTITNRETANSQSKAWVYKDTLLIPSEGDIELSLVLPSLAEWTDFQTVIDEIGKLIGFSGSASGGPMKEGFNSASASTATSASGTSTDSQFTWSWSRASADPKTETLVQVAAAADIALGTTGYTLLSGSLQEFSSGTTLNCNLDWKLSGGIIASVKAVYTGGDKTSPTFSSAIVNGFDFKQEFAAISYKPSGGDFGTFFDVDMKAIESAMGLMYNSPSPTATPSPGTPFADLLADKNAVFNNPPVTRNAGSGITSDSKFQWDWSGTAFNASTHTIKALANIALSVFNSSATGTLLANSTFKESFGSGSGFVEFNYQLSGSPVQDLKMKVNHTGTSELFEYYTINGMDLMPNLVIVTIMEGSTQIGSYHAFKDQKFSKVPDRPGYQFNGYYTDAALTSPWDTSNSLVTGALTLYGSWTLMEFAGGAGTSADPYQVATVAHLNNVRLHPGAWFRQTGPIDLNTFGTWTPIPAVGGNFTGTYNGQGFEIKNMTITAPSQSSGLFANTLGATLSNININMGSITGGIDANYGLLVGSAVNTTFSNCQANGSISAAGCIGLLAGQTNGCSISGSRSNGWVSSSGGAISDTGGLVGRLTGSSVANCYSTAKVVQTTSATAVVGGLIGSAEFIGTLASTITASYANGMVNNSSPTTSSAAGGMIGTTTGSVGYSVLVQDCYATGPVSGTGTGWTGGLIGRSTNAYTTIDRCFSAGPIGGGSIGGFIGSNGGCPITYSFFDTDSARTNSGALSVNQLEAVNNATMLLSLTFSSKTWSMPGTWTNQNGSYPYLAWQGSVNIPWAPPCIQLAMESDGTPAVEENSGFGGPSKNGSLTGVSYGTDLHPNPMGSTYSAIFPGTSNNISIAATDLKSASANVNMTLSAWIKVDPGATGLITLLSNVTSAATAGDNGFSVMVNTANNQLHLQAGDGGVLADYDFPACAVPKGIWTHITFVISNETAVSVYVNKVAAGTNTIGGTAYAYYNILNLGSKANSANFFFGLMDDVRIYTRALSAAEVNALY